MNNTPHIQTQRNRIITLAVGLAIAIGAIVGGQLATAASGRSAQTKPTIVLVHGAWADGSSWNEVTERLQRSGYEVRVPPNNLRSVATDAADLANYLGTIEGPVVLVGHSYGGMVITNAAVNAVNVEALVYVNALIPNEGDTLVGMTHPPSIFAQDPANVLDFVPYTNAPPEAVDTYVKPSIYGDAFANRGFGRREIEALAANQRPLSTQVFNEPSGPPAWATIPSWAVVGKYDQIIPVADQTSMAEHAGARVVTVDAPHLSMLTHDRDVANTIIGAAKSL
jgi:pimeloyl-ACP methyl ester carboxylesterase